MCDGFLLRALWYSQVLTSRAEGVCPSSPRIPSSLPYLCAWTGVPGRWGLPALCLRPPLGPGHLRADGSWWGLMLMLQTPSNTTATKVLVNCSCLNCIPVFSVLCLCSALLSCFLSVNKMLVLIHYCVMICSLNNIVHGGAVLSQGMCGNGLWWGAVPEASEPKEEARVLGRAGHPGWSCWLALAGRHRFLALLLQGTTLHLSCLWELGADGLAGAPWPWGLGLGST